ncbi:Mog1p/PsbP-like protein [Conidiobolus coronatus NRRL 28638]|uniref:Mog1p/PsbP-like protein n=1 Tax=Conidiobolus coronatus (strain ATCC 28846 / CBS 209.66 / NRRL 28638) TaxID=796925 RepID=A0A137NRD5_CONC2|nr:Mog1p/PsbP-like protein [Conidiobolus coronatus NRRL 28638]|eukprot:KXN65250.1 Mog1p/PsbP-like protein [Conidiobolus coronatus NRRL 28638]
MTNLTKLFGGAIEAPTPESFLDISTVRQVPDNQEVFADQNPTNQSIIFELLEANDEVYNDEIARFHFNQIAEDNEADEGSSNIEELINIDSNELPNFNGHHIQAYYVQGTQIIQPRKQEWTPTKLHIYLLIFRLPEVTTDLIITWQVPSELNDNVDFSVIRNQVDQLAKSLVIKDWSLFQ